MQNTGEQRGEESVSGESVSGRKREGEGLDCAGYKGLKYIWSNGPTAHKPETSHSLQRRTKDIKNRNNNQIPRKINENIWKKINSNGIS